MPHWTEVLGEEIEKNPGSILQHGKTSKRKILEHWDDIQDMKAEQNKGPKNNEEDIEGE